MSHSIPDPSSVSPVPEETALRVRPELRKQVSLFLPLSDWQALRQEAARQQVSMMELCQRWMRPQMDRLREK